MRRLFLFLFAFFGFTVIVIAQTTDPATIFQDLGVNVAVVGALIAFTQVIKQFLPESIKSYIALLPMVLSLAYAFVLGGYVGIDQKITMAFLYAAAAGYLFSVSGGIIKKIKG